MQRPTVYVETTIVSYLTARPSRDLVVAGHQRLTHDWWDVERPRHKLVTSQFTHREAGRGDRAFALARTELLRDIDLLALTREVRLLARELIVRGPLPAKAVIDAAHVAVAAVYGVDYLLTWNCRHIANPVMLRGLARVCSDAGYRLPILCTPALMLEGGKDDE